jgi:TPR repeat protein
MIFSIHRLVATTALTLLVTAGAPIAQTDPAYLTSDEVQVYRDNITGLTDETGATDILTKLEAAGEAGSNQALFLLGDLYSRPIGPIAKDGEKAVRYYVRSGENGNAYAFARAGDIYRDGSLIPEDLSKALSYYERASSEGNSTGRAKVGEFYIKGIGVEQDVDKGLVLVEEAAEMGGPSALNLLGELYSQPDAVPDDGQRAVDYYERSGEAGNTFAYVRIGDIYRDGRLLPVDLQKAFSYYEKAAEAGSVSGKTRVADAYIKGLGVERDQARGLSLLKDVGESGNLTAYQQAADYLRSGEYVGSDPQEALATYIRSAEAGNPDGYTRVAQMYLDGTAGQVDHKKAIEYYEKATAAGSKGAASALANAHITKRLGRLSDPKKAMAQLTALSAEGDKNATVMLSNAYYFADRSPGKAINLLEEAVKEGSSPAALRLISFYRDAPSGLIKKSPKDALRILEAARSGMNPDVIESESLLIMVSSASRISDFEKIYESLQNIPVTVRPDALSAMARVNPNAYVYVAQRHLRERGLYSGRLNGLLTSETIRSISQLCSSGAAPDRCRLGPLSPQAVRLVSIGMSQG